MDFIVPIASYVAVSSPVMYKFTSGILGQWVANSSGTPNIGGLILHAIVFIFLTAFILQVVVPIKSGRYKAPCSSDVDCGGYAGSCVKTHLECGWKWPPCQTKPGPNQCSR
jgi:hypothetical protein